MRTARDGEFADLDDIDAEIGRRVKARRVELGLSQQAVSASLGVSYQQLQKYETGRNRISASMLKRLADALGVKAAALFPLGASEPTSAPIVATHPPSRLQAAITELADAIADCLSRR